MNGLEGPNLPIDWSFHRLIGLTEIFSDQNDAVGCQ
jgi:hypothetical protein